MTTGRDRPRVPSLASLSFPASRFEREIHDLFGVEPIGHPAPRRLVLHQHWPEGWHPMRHDAPASAPMAEDAGVLPVRRGPGSGRLRDPRWPRARRAHRAGPLPVLGRGRDDPQDEGATVVRPQGDRAALRGPRRRVSAWSSPRRSPATAPWATPSRSAGRSRRRSASRCSPRAEELRVVLVELERLYNHVADIGALCNDVGFGLAQARALTLRERLLRLNRTVTGHRLLRGGVTVGGARTLVDALAERARRHRRPVRRPGRPRPGPGHGDGPVRRHRRASLDRRGGDGGARRGGPRVGVDVRRAARPSGRRPHRRVHSAHGPRTATSTRGSRSASTRSPRRWPPA